MWLRWQIEVGGEGYGSCTYVCVHDDDGGLGRIPPCVRSQKHIFFLNVMYNQKIRSSRV